MSTLQRFWIANGVILVLGGALIALSESPALVAVPWRESLRTVGLGAVLFVAINGILFAFEVHGVVKRRP